MYNEVLKDIFLITKQSGVLFKASRIIIVSFQQQNQPKEKFKTNLGPLFSLGIDLGCCMNCGDLLFLNY